MADRGRVADYIKSRRQDLGMSQEALAEAAGLRDARHISRWETDRTSALNESRGARGIEDALGWARGSLRRIYQGGEPVLADGPIEGAVKAEAGEDLSAVALRSLPEMLHEARIAADISARLLAELERLSKEQPSGD